MKKSDLYPHGKRRVNCFKLTNGTEVFTYLEADELDALIKDFRECSTWNAKHFIEYVNKKKGFDVIKVIQPIDFNK